MPLYCWGQTQEVKAWIQNVYFSARAMGAFGFLGLCPISMAAPYAWIAWFLTGPTSAISRVSLS